MKTDITLLTTWMRDFKLLKDNSSETHLFRAVKFLEKELFSKETTIRSKKVPNMTKPEFTPSDDAENIKNTIPTIGIIKCSRWGTPHPPLEREWRCQTSVRVNRPLLVVHFSASKLYEGFKIFRGCFIPNRKLLLSESRGKRIYSCAWNGMISKSVILDKKPCHMTLYDENRVLVTSSNGIQFIDLQDMSIVNELLVGKRCFGISSRDEIIWVKSGQNQLSVININGNLLNKITTTFEPEDLIIHQSRDLYCSDRNSDTIYTVTLDGRENEFFKSPDLNHALGITSDKNGDIYIAGKVSSNIHRISADGQNHEIILTSSDGIKQPTGLAYSNETNELMVINEENRSIMIFKIS